MSGIAQRTQPLPVAVVGCDFRLGSTEWRNALLLDHAERTSLSERLRRSAGINGFICIQTCNRVEWVLSAAQPKWAAELARAQMVKRWHEGSFPAPYPTPYVHVGEAAGRHLVRVSLGLESFVRGEREIAGQLNRAWRVAQAADTTSADLNTLQTVLGRVVRRVARVTGFGARARGIQGLAIDLARRELVTSATDRKRLCVIGMGEIGRRTATLAEQTGAFDVTRINRTIPDKQRGKWLPFPQIADAIAASDVVIVATGARSAVLEATHLAAAGDGLLVIDIGTPRQVCADVATVDYRGLDDLIVESAGSDEDLDAVLALVDDAVLEYRVALRKRAVAGLLRATQDRYDRFAYNELPTLLDHNDVARLAPEIRAAVRAYTRQIVAEIERSVGDE